MDSMDTFEELSLAVKGNTLVGEAQRNYLQGPKGPIRRRGIDATSVARR